MYPSRHFLMKINLKATYSTCKSSSEKIDEVLIVQL